MIKFNEIDNVEFDGIFSYDAPEFVDKYIVSCDINGKQATEEQLDEINDNAMLVQILFDKYYF